MQINKIRLFTILIAFLPVVVFAQLNTKSPYSIYGIGDMESESLGATVGMGDVKYGVASFNNINAANASTLGHIWQPTFDVGVKANFLKLTTAGQQQSTYASHLKNVNLAFPVSPRWGLSFGLMPYTAMGYDLEDTETVDNVGNVTYSYKGSGGINKVYFANGFNIINNDTLRFVKPADTIYVGELGKEIKIIPARTSKYTHWLSVGVSGSYMFGALSKERDIVVDDFTTYKTKYFNDVRFSGFNYDLSLTYRARTFYKDRSNQKKTFTFVLGGVYGLGTNLKTYTKDLVYTYTGGTVFQTKDTVLFALDTGLTTLPTKLGAGFSVEFNDRWLFAADYSSVDWTKYSLMNTPNSLAKHTQYAIGLQYTPDFTATTDFKKMIRYRAGFRYTDTRLVVKNTNLNEFGMTFGVGLPLLNSMSSTMFNIAFEYGQRGTEKNFLTKEQFTNIVVGFSMTPHKFDRWFAKRKID